VAHISADRGSVGLGAKSGPAYGVRYGIRLGSAFQIDVDGMYFPTEHAVLDTAVVDSAFKQIGTASQTLVVATLAMRLNLTGARTWHGLQPYVVFGGGGVIEAKKDKAAIETAPVDARFAFGTSFAGVFGGGFELFPTNRLAIRVDGRNILWKVKTPAALARGALGVTMPADEYVQNPTVSAGISIHF
jgi:hypothetical protein